jgi:molybdenum cofactor biosynthesis enzyme MoaA
MSVPFVRDDSIALHSLRELWVHTGTACNLSCAFCHEGSQPGDTRLQAVTAEQLAPVLQQAAAAGAARFIFTGGEPLTAREIFAMLGVALALRPTLVLTNGTAPLIRRSHQLAMLATLPHPLSFRISIDFPDEARHDAVRGPKNFRKALQGLQLLRAAGFTVGVACQRDSGGDADTARRFARLFQRHALPADLELVQLPQLGRPAAALHAGAPRALAAATLAATCCTHGRMLLRRDGELRFQACPLTDDDPRFDLGSDLTAALTARVSPRHLRCDTCLTQGVNYAGRLAP